jgi:ABC-type Fe3+/spermidine/putrescine transport system ATPase subunit
MAKAGLELVALNKAYGERRVVDTLSLALPKGELLTLLGPSGCGKTTVLRIIAGFTKPDTGDVLIDGDIVTGLAPEKRPTSIMFQSYALFPHMTVFENIAFGLRARAEKRGKIRNRVNEMIEVVGLRTHADHYPSQLSGGQKQRAALARSLIIEPKVLLLDEPFAALDQALREYMQIELRKLQQSLGTTMVVVTHDQNEAQILSDVIAVMNQGCIEQFGDPATIYARPNTKFVGTFMGVSNFLEGKLLTRKNKSFVRIGEHHLQLAEVPDRYHPGPVTVAIRQESFLVEPVVGPSAPSVGTADGGATNILVGNVRYARRVAGRTFLEVETPIGLIQTVVPRSTATYATGAPVSLSVQPRDMILVTV